ncbi:MAG: hypothetical protein ACRD1E_05475 [Terriglobales bacterium]
MGSSKRTVAGVGLVLVLACAAAIAQSPDAATAKLDRDYTKLSAKAARQQGTGRAESLAKLAILDADYARLSFRAQQIEPGEQHLDQIGAHADQACTLLQAEADRGKTGGMKNVETSLQQIGFALHDLAQQVHYLQRPKVEALAGHIADLRAKLLEWMFAPKKH